MARGRPSKKITILETAEQLFASQGYQGTSIDLVVREAGVSKPTVYNNFPSKQALIQELIYQKIETKKVFHQTLLATASNFADKIYAVFDAVVSSPFELAICKMYLGESHKLSDVSLALCQQFEVLLTSCVSHILKTEGFSNDMQFTILSIYNNGILINTLSNKKIKSSEELKRICQVIEN